MALPLLSSIWNRLPTMAAFRSSRFLILTTVCTAMFSDGFIYGNVAPVIPFLLQDEGYVAKVKVQLTTSYLMAAFSCADFVSAPLCAWYVDRTQSRRSAWYFGIGLLSTGSILFGFSRNVLMLYLSQILQGASSAILYTVGLAVLVDTVDSEKVGQWLGTAMAFNSFGLVMGPTVGGIVYEQAPSGKIAVFAITIALGVVGIVLRLLMKEQPRTELLQEATVLTAASVEPLVEGVDDHERSRKNSGTTTTSAVSTSVTETSPRPKVFQFRNIWVLVKSKRLMAAFTGIFINEIIIASLCTIIPLFVQEIFGWNSIGAGLIFLCVAVPTTTGYIAGWLTDRYGARVVVVFGFTATTPALLLLRLVDHDNMRHKILLCALLAITSTTLQFFLSPLGTEFSLVADEISAQTGSDLRATSFSITNCAISLGGALGPLVAGLLMDKTEWKGATLFLALICPVGILPCILWTGNKGKGSFRNDVRQTLAYVRAFGMAKEASRNNNSA